MPSKPVVTVCSHALSHPFRCALLDERRQLAGDGPPTVVEAQFLVPVAVAAVLVHDAGGVFRAVGVILEGDRRGDRRRVEGGCRSPAVDQRVGEDDPFGLGDAEKAAAQMGREAAAVRAHLGDERSAGAQIHGNDPALKRCWNPPLGEALRIGPGAPDEGAWGSNEARDRQVEAMVVARAHPRERPGIHAPASAAPGTMCVATDTG